MKEKEPEIEITAGYIRHIVNVMKERFGKETIVLFHVEDHYECFLEDSHIVSEILGIMPELYLKEEDITIYTTHFPATKLSGYRQRMTDEGYATCTNETRGADGKHILKIYEP